MTGNNCHVRFSLTSRLLLGIFQSTGWVFSANVHVSVLCYVNIIFAMSYWKSLSLHIFYQFSTSLLSRPGWKLVICSGFSSSFSSYLSNSLSSKLFLYWLFISKTSWCIDINNRITFLYRIVRGKNKLLSTRGALRLFDIVAHALFYFLNPSSLHHLDLNLLFETAGSAAPTGCTSYTCPVGYLKLPWVLSAMRWVRWSGNSFLHLL